MIVASVVHAAVLVVVAWWIAARLGGRISTSLLLFGAMWLIHGLPLQVYLHRTGPDTLIFEEAIGGLPRDELRSLILYAVAAALTLMMAGSEVARLALSKMAVRGKRALLRQGSDIVAHRVRLGVGARAILWMLAAGMLVVSLAEGQLGKVVEYFAFSESELARILLRTEGGGTPYYAYNLILYSVAPYLVMLAWCADHDRQRLPVLAGALFVAVMLGKFGTLSKAPPVIFLLQLVLLRVMLRRTPLQLRSAMLLLIASTGLFAVIVSLTIPDLDLRGLAAFLYYRVFDIPNESLLEYFAAIPASIPHGGGAGIFSFLRPDGEFLPMYSRVAELHRGSLASTSNAVFIADAWAEFGWLGLLSFAFVAGATVRAIDVLAFRDGDTDASACLIAGCSFGVFTALSTALPTAFLTGGLAILPLLMMATTRRPRISARTSLDAPSALVPGR
ncbi:hypothetical protein [uncultured Methylibium sp.]|uniref:hypothetical protein n=1 Tax=uncultured Methylibium sp. TaxID=381093 RepID=UPI0025EA899C|nr:hypothetical protein [uncultured Methylibium sp.]